MLILSLLTGCIATEEYPNVHAELYKLCSTNEEACEHRIQTELGDSEGISLVGMKWLIMESNPWLTNMIAANIKSITSDCPPLGKSEAYYHAGMLDPEYREVCIVDKERMTYMLTAAEVLVHEAGHGRPNASKRHYKCDGRALFTHNIGKEICDSNYDGALGSELEFWESMTLQPEPILSVAELKVELTLSLIQE